MTANISQETMPGPSPEIIAEHGLKPEEYTHLVELLGRTPNLTELGIFSVMWSEHCSYKSSKFWLKQLPTEGQHVIQGPGENAGIVDIGDGQAIVFKMESHNHPSYIEPFQGAATGVGGIMRDVFTMGARPIANLNALRFGSPDHAKTRHLVSGVVSGIGHYGNCIGVPTIAGETNFDARYDNNILVNAMCVGLIDANRIFYSAAAGSGNPVVYVGSKTGRDGIHGATMASAEFDDASAEKRPTVQVGDPFTEKLLLEACLELMQQDTIIAIQDMGAAGLTSSSVEMASKGGVGIRLDLDHVPQRETGMTAYEMMLSESQERMLMVLRPGSEAQAEAIFRKWDLDFAVIGETSETGRLELVHRGVTEADIPIPALADEAPSYERPYKLRKPPEAISAELVSGPASQLDALHQLMGSPQLCSRRWIWEQYDHMVMADTVQLPGSDAGVVRVHGTNKGIAATCDVTPRYCQADPFEGGKQAIAEAWRNLTATGADPLAVTDCLNFGNPERLEIMGEFVGCIQGMAQACRAFSFPVVSGNVSLYNETNGIAIPPTPGIGAVGLLPDLNAQATIALKPDQTVIMIGTASGHLGQSLYHAQFTGSFEGAPPPVDLEAEKATGDQVRQLIRDGLCHTVHDISDGGMLVALAEMALAGNLGATLRNNETGLASHAYHFGEDQGRYLLGVEQGQAEEILTRLKASGATVAIVAETGGDAITLPGEAPLKLEALRHAHESWFPAFFGEN